MRRNTITIIKYMLFAAIFFIVGPMGLKMLFGSKEDGVEKMNQFGRGLPEDPDQSVKVKRVSHCFGQF